MEDQADDETCHDELDVTINGQIALSCSCLLYEYSNVEDLI